VSQFLGRKTKNSISIKIVLSWYAGSIPCFSTSLYANGSLFSIDGWFYKAIDVYAIVREGVKE